MNLVIERGEFVFITGPSGAGKTTLLRLLYRAETRRRRAHPLPRPRRRAPHARTPCRSCGATSGIVFQDFKLVGSWSVFENVAVALEVLGPPAAAHPDARRRGARARRPRGPRRRPGGRPLRRRAAARRDRARHRRRAGAHPRRRADRATSTRSSRSTSSGSSRRSTRPARRCSSRRTTARCSTCARGASSCSTRARRSTSRSGLAHGRVRQRACRSDGGGSRPCSIGHRRPRRARRGMRAGVAPARAQRLLARGRVRVPRRGAPRRHEPPAVGAALGARRARVGLPEGRRDAGRGRRAAARRSRACPASPACATCRAARRARVRATRGRARTATLAGAARRGVPGVDRARRRARHDRRRADRHRRQAEALPAVDDVETYQSWTERLARLVRGGVTAAALLAIVVLAAVLAVVGSTMRLALQRRRTEVEVLKLVGATDGFVKSPFVVEGSVQGALGAVGAIALLAVLFLIVRGRLDGELASLVGVEPTFLPWPVVVGHGGPRRGPRCGGRAGEPSQAGGRMRIARRAVAIAVVARSRPSPPTGAPRRASGHRCRRALPAGARRSPSRRSIVASPTSTPRSRATSSSSRVSAARSPAITRASLARGAAFYRLTRAGLLPVGGGFDALVTHAMHVERARRVARRRPRA